MSNYGPLLDVLRLLVKGHNDNWIRLRAMEKTLENYPEVRQRYEAYLDQLENDPAVALNRESSLERLAELHRELLQGRGPGKPPH